MLVMCCGVLLARDLGGVAGVIGENGRGRWCRGKPGTGKLDDCVCLCGSALNNGCVVNGSGCILSIVIMHDTKMSSLMMCNWHP